MTDGCSICGKPNDHTGFNIYTSKCGSITRCHDHANTGFCGFPDFGKDYCKRCGNQLRFMKKSEKKHTSYCNKCCQTRSGRNIIHIHGKDCVIKEEKNDGQTTNK